MMRRFMLWGLLLLASCASERSGGEQIAQADRAALSGWIARVRESHAQADRRRDAAALQALTDTATAGAPSGVDATDAVQARQDLYVHAASLALEIGQVARAAELTRAGLALPPYPGPFRAQLLIVSSRAKSALGDAAGAATDRQAARAMLAEH